MKRTSTLLVLLAFTLSGPSALAADYYISPAGSDAAGTGTALSPWRTLAFAKTKVGAGDTLWVGSDGDPATVDYEDSIDINPSQVGLKIRRQSEGDDYPHVRVNGTSAISIGADGVTIQGLEFSGQNPAMGIDITGIAGGALIDDCRFVIKDNQKLWRAINVTQGGTGHTISNCHFEQQSYGLWAAFATLSDPELILSGNTFVNCTAGAEMTNVEGTQLLDNLYQGGSHALKCLTCPRTTFSGNTLDGLNGEGLYFSGSPHTLVEGNAFAQRGVTLASSSYSRVLGNTFALCGTGINLDGSTYVAIQDNLLESGGKGIRLSGSSAISLGNTVTSHSGAAVQLDNGWGIFAFNDLSGNAGKGAYVSGAGGIFFANRFATNEGGHFDGYNPKDLFATPVPLAFGLDGLRHKSPAGNYYDDYAGADDGSDGGIAGDGIGDTLLPYAAPAAGDPFPLMNDPAAYDWELWFLGNGTLIPPGAPLEVRQETTLDAGKSMVFAADTTAQGHVVYPPASVPESSWSLLLRYGYLAPGESLDVRVGWIDDNGLAWFGDGVPTAAVVKGESSVWLPTLFDPGLLVVPHGAHLALRVNNTTSKFFNLGTVGSFLSAAAPDGPAWPEGGQQPAFVDLAPAGWDLGEVEFGQSYPLSLQVTNSGAELLEVIDFQVAGPHAAELTIGNDGCTGDLPAGESCTVDLTFAPVAGGPKAAGIIVHSSDPQEPWLYAHLSALAGPQHPLTVAVEPPGAGTVTGPGIDCNDQCTVQVDQGQTVQLEAAPAAEADFVGWSGCGAVEGTLCTVTVTAATEVTAQFAPFAPDLSLSPEAADFGEHFVGEASTPQILVLENVGKMPATLGKISIEGDHPADFVIEENSCGQTLEVGIQCTLSVAFKPTADGDRQALLTVLSDDFDTPELTATLTGSATIKPRTLTVLLLPEAGGHVTGEGIDCPGDCEETFPDTVVATLDVEAAGGYTYIQWTGCDQVQGTQCTVTVDKDKTVSAVLAKKNPAVEVQPLFLDFGDIAVGSASAPQSVTVSNLGNWPLDLGSAVLDGLFAGDFAIGQDNCSGMALEAGGTCTVAVVFSPTARSLRGATLNLPSSDLLHPSVEVAVFGFGLQDIEEPELPEMPLSGDPIVRPIPGSLNFGQQGLWSGPGHLASKVCNVGGGEVTVSGPSIDGGDKSHFDIEDFSCSGMQLKFGECCGANIFFSPQSGGEKRGYAVYTVEGAPESEVRVPLFGVGDEYKTPSNTSTKAERGCSAAVDGPASPWAAALLLTALLLLLLMYRTRSEYHPFPPWGRVARRAGREGASHRLGRVARRAGREGASRRFKPHYAFLLLCLFLGSGTTSVTLSGCDANATGECLGDFSLSGTGVFDAINTTFRFMFMSTSITTGCHQTQFTILEDVPSGGYINNENFAVGIYLTSPLFPGRRYGKGTELSVTLRGHLVPLTCYVTKGYIEVGDLLMLEKPEACATYLELKFNIEDAVCPGGRPGWEGLDLVPGGSSLIGWGKFSYGAVLEECSPPPVEDGGGSLFAGTLGQAIFPPGAENPQEEYDLPVEYWGTEVNRVHATHMVRATTGEDGATELADEILLDVEPPPVEVGNWLCRCPDDYPKFHPRCLDLDPHDPFSTFIAPTEGGAMESMDICDRFGVKPVIVPDWETGPPPPIIVSPYGKSEHYKGDPLVLKWEAQPDFGDGTVVIRAYNGDYLWNMDEEPRFEFATEDTGEITFDPAMLSVLDGETTFEIERSHVITPEFNIPLREGSSVLVRKFGAVGLVFKEGATILFPDPDLPATEWTEPEELGQMSLDFWMHGEPVLSMGTDGLLHAAWMGGLNPTYQVFDTKSLEWRDPDAPQSGLYINNGPLGLAAGDGVALLWGLDKPISVSEFRPVAYRWTQSLEGGKLEGADAHEKAWAFGGTLLDDGTAVLGWTNADKLLYWSVDLAPFQLVGTGYEAALSDSTFFPRSDHKAVVFPKGITGWWLVLDPAGNDPIEQLSFGAGQDIKPCPEAATTDEEDNLHMICLSNNSPPHPEHYAASLFTGDYAATPTFVSQDPVLTERYVGHKAVFGRDGTLWLLWQVTCEHGVCPLLYKQDEDGDWVGPYFGGQAVGTMDMAVDAAGRIHLVYSPELIESGGQGTAPLFHTMMEVAP